MTVPALRDTKEPNKLILCFDGTGNSFSGSNADTNVVKILNKLDRQHPQQFHYYQTGVGTYSINELSVHKTWLGEMRSNISMTIDQAVGTTFDAHVMAGYRFLMRHYTTVRIIYRSTNNSRPNKWCSGRQDLHVRVQPRCLHS
jgi:uncharacterized protein (DUF2235 family)